MALRNLAEPEETHLFSPSVSFLRLASWRDVNHRPFSICGAFVCDVLCQEKADAKAQAEKATKKAFDERVKLIQKKEAEKYKALEAKLKAAEEKNKQLLAAALKAQDSSRKTETKKKKAKKDTNKKADDKAEGKKKRHKKEDKANANAEIPPRDDDEDLEKELFGNEGDDGDDDRACGSGGGTEPTKPQTEGEVEVAAGEAEAGGAAAGEAAAGEAAAGEAAAGEAAATEAAAGEAAATEAAAGAPGEAAATDALAAQQQQAFLLL